MYSTAKSLDPILIQQSSLITPCTYSFSRHAEVIFFTTNFIFNKDTSTFIIFTTVLLIFYENMDWKKILKTHLDHLTTEHLLHWLPLHGKKYNLSMTMRFHFYIVSNIHSTTIVHVCLISLYNTLQHPICITVEATIPYITLQYSIILELYTTITRTHISNDLKIQNNNLDLI